MLVVISAMAGYIDNNHCQLGVSDMQQLMLNYGEDLQFAFFFGCLFIFLIIERLAPERRVARSQHRRWRTNSALTILAILVLPLLPVTFITAGYWAQENDFGLLNNLPVELPIWAIALATLLLRGFISFFTHLLNHRLPFLWRLHRVHHMDTELDVSSTVRFHPLEMPVSMIIGLPMIALLGLSPWALLFYELFDASIVVFSHSNISLPAKLERVLRYIIVTPDLHKVHHSAFQPETDSNFSAVFPVWDIIFGTFRTQTVEPLSTMPLGIEEVGSEKAEDFIWLLSSPFRTLAQASDNPGQGPVRVVPHE